MPMSGDLCPIGTVICRKSASVVGMARQDCHCAIELFQKHDAHKLVWPGGSPKASVRLAF